MAWQPFRFTGYAPDLPADAVPLELWSNLINAQIRDGMAERAVGDNDKAISSTPITRWEFGVALNSPTASALVYGGNDYAGPRARVGVFVVGGAHVDITPGAWAATPTTYPNFWTGGPFSTGVLLNDVIHDPIWVSPAYGVTVITATNFNALRPYKYMAVGIGDKVVAGAENTVRWSASVVPGAAPNVWAPAAGNDAGDFDLSAAGFGPLIDGGALGEDFLIYGENTTHSMTYVGGSTVMASRRLSSLSGVMSRNCWADIGRAHVVLTKDDVILIDQSGTIKSIVEGRLRRSLFTALYNADGRQLNSQVWYDRRRGLVYICTTQAGSALDLTFAAVYHPASDSWGTRLLTNTGASAAGFIKNVQGACNAVLDAAAAGSGQPRMVVFGRGEAGGALADAELHYLDSNAVLASKAAETVLQKDDLDFSDASRLKVITGLRLRGTAPSTVTLKVSVGVKNAADAAYVYSAEQDVILPSTQRAPFLVTGRWVSVKVRAPDNTDVQFRLMGFDLEYQPGGEW